MPSSQSALADPGRSERLAALIARPFAHRGLHGYGRPENSRSAFRTAISAGDSIELDVRANKDGAAFVFHDAELERTSAGRGRLADLTALELRKVALRGTNETIPPLGAILTVINGDVPVLIELKCVSGQIDALCSAVASDLDGYRGAAAIMAFDPRAIAWFRSHRPHVLRGLVISTQGKSALRARLEYRLAKKKAAPDFLACDIRDLPAGYAASAREDGLPILTWTVRGDAWRAHAAAHADQIIYEETA